MSEELARELYTSGRSHGLSADLLFRSALEEGHNREDIDDPEHYAFNGPYSLAVNYLLGLSLELMLKAAIVAWEGPASDEELRSFGHDLIKTLKAAEEHGFEPASDQLRGLLEIMRKPYKHHWFRYQRPEQMPLPGDWGQIVSILQSLDEQLEAKLDTD